MDDESPVQEWEQEQAIDKEFQDVFYDIENDEAKTLPEQVEREKRLKKKQKILEQMQSEQELGNKIRGLQMGKSDKQTTNTNIKAVKRARKSGNPNGGSGSDAEPLPNRQEWDKKSGGVKAYDSPSNREVRNYQDKQTGEGTHGKHKGGKAKSKGKGARYFFPSPDCDDPLVKMQSQMEI